MWIWVGREYGLWKITIFSFLVKCCDINFHTCVKIYPDVTHVSHLCEITWVSGNRFSSTWEGKYGTCEDFTIHESVNEQCILGSPRFALFKCSPPIYLSDHIFGVGICIGVGVGLSCLGHNLFMSTHAFSLFEL
jgi:hypothetical protein